MTTHQPRNMAELDAMLKPMFLTAELIADVLRNGAAEARNWTSAAPAATPEGSRWARTVETLTLETKARGLGWMRRDEQNLPRLVHPSTTMELLVSSGDAFTGVQGFRPPSTRNPKGARFLSAVNAPGQGSFFDVVTDEGDMIEISDGRVLLYDERGGIVYCELSVPKVVEKDHIVAWRDRILLPPFDVSGSRFIIDDDDEGGEHAFTITRKTS